MSRTGVLSDEPFATVEAATFPRRSAGLLGFALDPDFEELRYVYFCYTYHREDSSVGLRVGRLTEVDKRGEDLRTLLELPGFMGHIGCRVKFGPDRKLYVTVGDGGDEPSSRPQDLDVLSGKILRVERDGTVPPDNPFPGSPVYSYGHRNPQGLAWHPATKRLFATEHGPSEEPPFCCHDELNLIAPGGNYGWAKVYGTPGDRRYLDPVLESGLGRWAPSGATFYSGNVLPSEWRGRLFFATLFGQHIHWVDFRPPAYEEVMAEGKIFDGRYGRIRDVAEGPDGYLYFTTSNNQAGDGPPDSILRIVPTK